MHFLCPIGKLTCNSRVITKLLSVLKLPQLLTKTLCSVSVIDHIIYKSILTKRMTCRLVTPFGY